MSVYFVVQQEITDAEALAPYRAMAQLAPNPGKVIAAGPSVNIEGDYHGSRTVIIEFDDEAAFQTWYDSPEYQAALRVRLSATDSRSALVPGVG
jgi:uncharacterized protein (DUF1330 family)